jgi:hypothetical protein
MKPRVGNDGKRCRVACVERFFRLKFLFLEACPELLTKGSSKKKNTQFLKLLVLFK